MLLTVSDLSQPTVAPGLDMPGPELAPRVHRFHVNPLLKNAEDVGRGARGEGGRAGRLLSAALAASSGSVLTHQVRCLWSWIPSLRRLRHTAGRKSTRLNSSH